MDAILPLFTQKFQVTKHFRNSISETKNSIGVISLHQINKDSILRHHWFSSKIELDVSIKAYIGHLKGGGVSVPDAGKRRQ